MPCIDGCCCIGIGARLFDLATRSNAWPICSGVARKTSTYLRPPSDGDPSTTITRRQESARHAPGVQGV